MPQNDRVAWPPQRSHPSRRAVLGALSGACLAGAGRAASAAEGASASFGMTPVCLSYDLDLVERLRAHLAARVGGPVRVVTRRTYAEITNMLLAGDLDAAWICGYPYVVHRDELELVAVPSWRGRPFYQAYLIVPRDRADCASVADLRHDTHAFSDPDSNSGYLVTAATLARDGQRPSAFFGRTFFTYSHRDVVRAVAAGLADSGSVDGYVWEVLAQTEPMLAGATRVVGQSPWMGFPPVATSRARAASPAASAIRAALLGMSADEAGRGVLRDLWLDGFVEGQPSAYDSIAAEVAAVRAFG